MPRSLIPLILCAILQQASLAAAQAAATGPLADYVAAPDSSYSWRVHSQFHQAGADILELRLYSQTWKNILWKHRMFVIKPSRISSDRHGLLIVAGGRWRDRYDAEVATELPDSARVFAAIAKRLRAVVAVVGQVPFEPVFDLTEDRAIAYTLDQYLTTGDSEWPLLLPMVKSAARAMDAFHEVAAEEWDLPLATYTVMGGSKRGWTTWLTAAVDARVTAVVPVVIDVLNFEAHFPHQTEVWGRPSDAIRPYTDLNLHVVLSSEAGRPLRDIIDPYSYRSFLTQPKLIVNATNDEYFPLDSLNLYWGALVGPKFILYLPNNRHGIRDLDRLIPSLKAINDHAALQTPLPDLAWEFQQDDRTLTLCVRSEPGPRRVRAWKAVSSTGDFRSSEWSQARIRKQGEGAIYVYELPRPASGYTALFAETVFGWWRSANYLSTNVNIVGAPGSKALGRFVRGTPGICPPEN